MEKDEVEIYAEMNRDMISHQKAQRKLKNEYKAKLRGLINVAGLFKWLDDGHEWSPESIVEIVMTDEKLSGYQTYQHARIIKDTDKLLYMKTSFDEGPRGIQYYYVWQTSGMLGDDYSGYILFPLNDGKFFKVSYCC